MATPHIRAEAGDFADTVLLPGDPLRAKFIAENYFDEPHLVTDVRNMFGYTGTVNGVPISVQGSGMGVPSISIYATELIQEFGVTKLIRVGSCGSLADDVELGDVILAIAAGTDSNVNRRRLEGRDFGAAADWTLLKATADAGDRLGIETIVGRIFTSDLFYDPDEGSFDLLRQYGFIAVEMEAAALYGLAAEHDVGALAVCTVSDHIARHESMSIEDRESSFDDMIRMVLDAAAGPTPW